MINEAKLEFIILQLTVANTKQKQHKYSYIVLYIPLAFN